MTIAQFSLVNKVDLTVIRQDPGEYVNGDWVEGADQEVIIQGNYHPFADYQVMRMPESDKTKSWMWLFTSDLIRSKKEGVNGYGADRVMLDGELYEVTATQKYSMRVVDHYEAKLVRVELTPN